MLDQIEARLTALGWSGARLAKELGWTPQRVSDVRRGRYDPKLSTIETIAEAIGCDVMLLGKYDAKE